MKRRGAWRLELGLEDYITAENRAGY